jgi:subtilisin-like proprotein convertase family protein
MNLRGRWALNLQDMQENDTAVLKSFDLRAPLAEKVDCRK